MNIGDIISDALVYPLHNIKSLVIYIVLGIIAAIIGGTTILTFLTAAGTTGISTFALDGVGIIGILIFLILLFLIQGYALDIIKFGIERRADGPGIDFGRQVTNAIKLIAVDIAYYLIPAVIIFILGIFLRDWILTIISIILIIIFALANFMARCRLAKTDNLGAALAVGEAIGDISRVGIGRLIATVIIVIIIALLIIFIVGIFAKINDILGDILLGIALVYLVFFYHRAIGLLYSDV
ncbi:DUF4013 domain-containing protein [Methanobrevibacter sp.]|uniref:DUF4013 domain-containing protein n=1 Tax=Methanobrevibacter sp. TaxID=66852 RepID=UPI002E75F09F|nr:DUF4013 domain-containing protein [Methanobrevibacter sp.]MEE1335805.1 DUF4013 domain-containing protein [Methanobrevibacter sp.]